MRMVEGKYRWDLVTKGDAARVIEAPYGPVVDFYAAVDARLVASRAKDQQISLLFGMVTNSDYSFVVGRGPKGTFYILRRYDGTKLHDLITWTPVPIKLDDTNRFGVVVEKSIIKLLINSTVVAVYRERSFSGGKVGLGVGIPDEAGSVVVDFDNFELRRKGD